MKKIKEKALFISYNHRNLDLKEKLSLKLSHYCPEMDIVSDSLAEPGKQLHKEISRLVNACQVIVPIVTKEWLASHETRDELIRAHERRKYIICFLFSGDFKTSDELPFYLRERLRIHFTEENIEQKIRELADTINDYKFFWKRPLFESIRIVGDYLEDFNSNLPSRKEHLFDAFKRVRSEVSQIVNKDTFKRKVSYEDNFLRAASPYFRSATGIYAISIAEISSFWDNGEVFEAVESYLQEQSENTKTVIRLFVFQDMAEANKFKNIIHANHQYYGKNGGGVFFGSIEGYHDFLHAISTDQTFLRAINDRDFGVLTYNTEEGKHTVSAILDPHDLFLEEIDLDENNSYKSFILAMRSLLSIEEGEIGDKFPVVRWSTALYKEPQKLREALSKIFDGSSGPILHLVFIKTNKTNSSKVYSALQNLLENFISAEKELNLDNIWLRQRKDLVAHDGRFLGRLIINKQYDFVLGFEFANEKSLKNYYEHRMHSLERERLYSVLDPNSKPIFEQIKLLSEQSSKDKEIEGLFNKIEERMKRHLMRVDISLNQEIDNIIKEKGTPFGSKYKL